MQSVNSFICVQEIDPTTKRELSICEEKLKGEKNSLTFFQDNSFINVYVFLACNSLTRMYGIAKCHPPLLVDGDGPTYTTEST